MTRRARHAGFLAAVRRVCPRLLPVGLACSVLASAVPARPVAAQVTGTESQPGAEAPGPPPAVDAPAPTAPPEIPVPVPADPPEATISPAPTVELPILGEFLDLFGLPGYPGFPVPARRPAAPIEVRPFVALSEIYTDNFRLSATDPEENFRTILSLGLGFRLTFPLFQTQLALGMSAAYDTLTDEFRLRDNLLLLGQAQQTWQPTPNWTLTATEMVTRSDEPGLADTLGLRERRDGFTAGRFSLVSDYLIGALATQQFYRLSVFVNDTGRDTIAHQAGLQLRRTFFQRTTASTRYTYLASSTSPGDDVTGHEVRASLAHQLGYFANVGISGSHAWRTATASDGSETDFTLSTVAVFAGTGIPGAWSLHARVGASHLDRDPDRDAVRLFGNATLTSLYFAPLTVSLRGHAGFSETYAEGESFGVVYTRGLRLSLSYPLTAFVRATGTAFYRDNEFTGVAGDEVGRTDIVGGALLIAIRLRAWLSMGLGASRTERTSLTQPGRIVEHRATVTLRAGF